MFEILTHIIATTDFNAIDLLTKVDSFYQNSFTKLIWVISIALVVVGVVVPLVVNRLQQRTFTKAETNLLGRIAETREELTEKITSKSDAVKNDLIQYQQKTRDILQKELNLRAGIQYRLHAFPLTSDTSKSLLAFTMFIHGANQFLQAGEVDLAKSTLKDAESISSSLPTLLKHWLQKDIDQTKKVMLDALEILEITVSTMEDKGDEHVFSDQIEAFRSKIQQLKGNPEHA